jgi:hypothetical protein
MPKSHRKKTRRGGGWFDDLKNKTSGLTSGMSTSSWSPSSWTSGVNTSSWNPFAKKETPASTSPPPTSPPISPPATPSSSTMQTMGGKRRRVKRGGSYSANMSQTNLAATASPVSGIQTVKAQTWVGGKTKRRRHRHKHNKSCKHR